jgi:hypothetical protein
LDLSSNDLPAHTLAAIISSNEGVTSLNIAGTALDLQVRTSTSISTSTNSSTTICSTHCTRLLLIRFLALQGARAVAQAIVSADGEPLSVLTFGDNDSMNIPMQDCHRSPQVFIAAILYVH